MNDNIFYYNSDQTLTIAWNEAKLIFNPISHVYIHMPLNIVETLPDDWYCKIYRDQGNGNVRFKYDGGVYLKSRFNKPQTDGQGSVIYLEKISNNTLWLSGDLKNE